MARAASRPIVDGFPWRALARPLGAAARLRLAATLRELVAWQRRLHEWPALDGCPDATPFVAVHAQGRLRGCVGTDEGAPGERLARAFLQALHDRRFGAVQPDEREHLVAQVSYARDVAPLDPERALGEIEAGTDGVALIRPHTPPAALLPQVARDHGLGARELLAALARKAGLPADGWRGAALFRFTTDDVRSDEGDTARERQPERAAATWLAGLVGADGAMSFAVDARARERVVVGEMHHGRVAVALHALSRCGSFRQKLARGRARLAVDLRAGLAGGKPPGWPTQAPRIAGTLALATLAGLDLKRELLGFAGESTELGASPWHAAQVATALGCATPEPFWRRCVADLDVHPWAPWTAMAARARGDGATLERCARALIDSIRLAGPHAGGAAVTATPEIALTAAAVEALAPLDTAAARAAVRLGREFLRRWQLLPGRIPAGLDETLAAGAFPASPVLLALRCDVTGHALLALSSPSDGKDGR